MALLDDILRLLGTNRTRMQWKLRAWRRAWERRKASFANRTAAPTVQHRARRAAALLWGDGIPIVTSALAVSFITIYAITIVWGKQVGVAAPPMMPSSLALWRFGSEYSIDIQAGQWWRLVTCTFLHVHLLHLFFNLASLWSVGIYLEEALGRAKTLALYLLLAGRI